MGVVIICARQTQVTSSHRYETSPSESGPSAAPKRPAPLQAKAPRGAALRPRPGSPAARAALRAASSAAFAALSLSFAALTRDVRSLLSSAISRSSVWAIF